MDTISDIKRAVPIRDFCARVGIELNHKHFACCIFHNEKTPSMCVYEDGGFKCFGCGASGDVIDLAKEVWNCGTGQAIDGLCKMYGIANRRNSAFTVENLFAKRRNERENERRDEAFAKLEAQKFEAARNLDLIKDILRSPPDSPESMTEKFVWALTNKDYFMQLYDEADAEIMRILRDGI